MLRPAWEGTWSLFLLAALRNCICVPSPIMDHRRVVRSDKVLSYGDCLLRRQDAALLRGPLWLNDQVIGFYFEFLVREAFRQHHPALLLVPGSAAFLLASLGAEGGGAAVVLEPHGFPRATQLALFAVNDNPDVTEANGGSHWTLLAWSAADGVFRHFDSLGGGNARAARRVYEAAAAGLPDGGSSSRLLEQHTPQQNNPYDCGVYVLALARLLCERFAVDGPAMSFEVSASEVSPQSVTALRSEIYELIFKRAEVQGTADGLPLPDS